MDESGLVCPECGHRGRIYNDGCKHPEYHIGHQPLRYRTKDETNFWVGFVVGVIFRSIFRFKRFSG
jgi:hypothetical protein